MADPEANKRIVRELYACLHAKGDTAAADKILGAQYVDHDLPGPFPGNREGLKQAVLAVRASFPDVTPELHGLIGEGEWVAVRVEAAGTHTGEPFNGIPPTGRTIRWKEQHMFRVEDGTIVEHRGVFDLLGILQQLGAIPMPE